MYWPKDLTGFKNLSGLVTLDFSSIADKNVCSTDMRTDFYPIRVHRDALFFPAPVPIHPSIIVPGDS